MFSAPSGIPLPPMIARMLNGSQGAVTTTSVAGPDGASAAAPDGAPPAASAAQPATAATEPANASSANGSAGENAGGARRGKLELPALERALAEGSGAGTSIESVQQMQGAVLSELASSALELLSQELQGDVDLSRDDLPPSRPTRSTVPPLTSNPHPHPPPSTSPSPHPPPSPSPSPSP